MAEKKIEEAHDVWDWRKVQELFEKKGELYELFEYFVEVPEWPVKKVQT